MQFMDHATATVRITVTQTTVTALTDGLLMTFDRPKRGLRIQQLLSSTETSTDYTVSITQGGVRQFLGRTNAGSQNGVIQFEPDMNLDLSKGSVVIEQLHAAVVGSLMAFLEFTE